MDFTTIFELLLIIFIGIPFVIIFIIPLLVYLGEKTKRIPSFTFLLIYFKIDITKPPYSEWMERSPILFVSMTSIEIYVSYYLIKLIRLFKWIVKGIWWFMKNTIGRYVKWQWKKYDEEFDAQEKEAKQQ
jgi:hypothetical protein